LLDRKIEADALKTLESDQLDRELVVAGRNRGDEIASLVVSHGLKPLIPVDVDERYASAGKDASRGVSYGSTHGCRERLGHPGGKPGKPDQKAKYNESEFSHPQSSSEAPKEPLVFWESSKHGRRWAVDVI
jgi:hypothetical protein